MNHYDFLRFSQVSQLIGTSNDVNCMFDVFFSKLFSIVDKHILLRQWSKKGLKHFREPWISQGIRKSIKLKNNY